MTGIFGIAAHTARQAASCSAGRAVTAVRGGRAAAFLAEVEQDDPR